MALKASQEQRRRAAHLMVEHGAAVEEQSYDVDVSAGACGEERR